MWTPGIHIAPQVVDQLDGIVTNNSSNNGTTVLPQEVQDRIAASREKDGLAPIINGGVSPTGTPYNPKRPGKTHAYITDQQLGFLKESYYPIENMVVNSLRDNSIVDTAKEYSTAGFRDLDARNSRNLGRYGQQMTPLQASEFKRNARLAENLTYDTAVNDAYVAQRERNDRLRRELINIGRGVAQEATSSFANVAGLDSQRRANNRAIDAQTNAAIANSVGSSISSAILAIAYG